MKQTVSPDPYKPSLTPCNYFPIALATGLALSLAASVASAQAKAPPTQSLLSIGLKRVIARTVVIKSEHSSKEDEMPFSSAQRTAVSPALKTLAGFFSVGGYFLTNSSGRRALGDAKFSGSTAVFVRPAYPKALGGLALTGGAQIFSVNDHFFPFSGGSDFTLIGPAFSVTTRKANGRPRAYLIGGLYYGHLRSERLHFDRSAFTPSVAVGADYAVGRYVTLYAGYRVSQEIHGYNTDGFSVGFRLF